MTAPQNEAQKAEIEKHPRSVVKPIEGNLKGLCDTFIAVAEFDPLIDEGLEYARRLTQAGVKVTSRVYTGVPHSFVYMLPIQKALLHLNDMCSELKRAHKA